MTDTRVDNDLLLVSHSQIGTWNRCSMKWHIGYNLGWTSKVQPAYFDRGHMIHEGLETYYNRFKDGKPLGDASFLPDLIGQWMQSDKDLSMISAVGKLLERYIKEYSPVEDRLLKVLDVEKHVLADLITPKGRHYKLQGYLDLIVEVNGKVWIVDHKSSGSARFKTEQQVLMDAQLPIYAALLRDSGVDVFGMVFNFLNTYEYKTAADTSKLFQRIVTYRTDVELRNIVTEFGRAVDDIYENRNDPRREFGFDCDRCAFQEPCMMNMRGVGFEKLMHPNFVLKNESEDIIVEFEET